MAIFTPYPVSTHRRQYQPSTPVSALGPSALDLRISPLADTGGSLGLIWTFRFDTRYDMKIAI